MNRFKCIVISGILIFGAAASFTGCDKPSEPAANAEQDTQDGAVALASDSTPSNASDALPASDAALDVLDALADPATPTDN